MRGGRLKRRVNIESKVTSTGTDGGTSESWKVIASKVAAGIEPLKGTEFHAAGGVQSDTDHKIIMRHRKGLKKDMRIVYRKRVFEIKSIIDIREENRELHLMCKEHDG